MVPMSCVMRSTPVVGGTISSSRPRCAVPTSEPLLSGIPRTRERWKRRSHFWPGNHAVSPASMSRRTLTRIESTNPVARCAFTPSSMKAWITLLRVQAASWSNTSATGASVWTAVVTMTTSLLFFSLCRFKERELILSHR